MPEWWSYTPSDFLMFSPRVYYRLIEAYNAALWPGQIVAALAGLGAGALMLRGSVAGRRLAFVLLALAWAWAGWGFLWQRYAGINWSAAYLTPLFGVQALALLWFGAVRGGIPLAAGWPGKAGLALFAAAVLLYPLVAVAMGRGWLAAESFGAMPDPTAIATLGLLAAASGRARWLAGIIPALWCVLSALTLWTMGEADFVFPLIGLVAAIGIALAPRSAGEQLRPDQR